MADSIISCDWGTTRFRLRAIRTADWQVTAEVTSAAGAAMLAETAVAQRPQEYTRVFRQSLSELASRCRDSLENATAFISGMASSSIGWLELPYARIPFALDG